jgi:hypothetical protein
MLKKTSVALAALGLAAVATPAAALDWSDNSFRVQYGPSYHETATYKLLPDGTPSRTVADIAKTTLNFTHASGDKLGGTFVSIDMYLSDKADPAQGMSTQGATEVFAVLRRDFSLNKITDTKTFSFTGVRDVSLDLGLDIGTKNNAFASHIVRPFVGPQLSFDVPGFLTVGVAVTKEWNNNGIAHDGVFGTGGPVVFNTTGAVLAAWGIPLGSLPLQFAGFANAILPKGKDAFGNQTATEIIAQPKIMWDVAKTFTSTRTGYELGVGYQFWMNKYGNDENLKVAGAKVNDGSISNTVFFEAAIHI